MLEKGLKHTETMTVTENLTAKAMGSGTLDVLATPAMAALMEKASMNLVAPYLEEGKCTVGTKLDLLHTSATYMGNKVRCESELAETDGRRLVFTVTAYDDAGEIGSCRHERFIVDSNKFTEKAKCKIKS